MVVLMKLDYWMALPTKEPFNSHFAVIATDSVKDWEWEYEN